MDDKNDFIPFWTIVSVLLRLGKENRRSPRTRQKSRIGLIVLGPGARTIQYSGDLFFPHILVGNPNQTAEQKANDN